DAVNLKQQKINVQSDEWKRLATMEGQCFWLLARALRDRAYAQAMADQKPLQVVDDTSTGEKYRDFYRIPEPEDRQLALISVGYAAGLLDDPEITKSALRIELVNPALQWEKIDNLAQQTLKHDPKDARAQYLLARYEFEQPEHKENRYEIKPW